MPFSARENDADVLDFVFGHNIETVLDVGAGSGTYGRMLKDNVDVIEAVEIWQPYVREYNLLDVYSEVHLADVRDLEPEFFAEFDLVIFGDILEHMTRKESLDVWEAASTAQYGLISVPVIHWPQGEVEGNPYEEHIQEHMETDALREDFGPFMVEWVYDLTGTFIKDFTKEENE